MCATLDGEGCYSNSDFYPHSVRCDKWRGKKMVLGASKLDSLALFEADGIYVHSLLGAATSFVASSAKLAPFLSLLFPCTHGRF